MQICCTYEKRDSGASLLTLGNRAYTLSTLHKTWQLAQLGINCIGMRTQKPVILLIKENILIKVNTYFKSIQEYRWNHINTTQNKIMLKHIWIFISKKKNEPRNLFICIFSLWTLKKLRSKILYFAAINHIHQCSEYEHIPRLTLSIL